MHNNLHPVVKFAHDQSLLSNDSLTGKESELHHTYSQIRSMIDHLNRQAEKETVVGNEKKATYCKHEAAVSEELLSELQANPESFKLTDIYQVVLNNWDILKDWPFTYRLLYDLIKLEKGCKNDPQNRQELLKIIVWMSDEWKEE